ncbi:MAG TPA: pirin family protein [Acetobacteraceae bacterium]
MPPPNQTSSDNQAPDGVDAVIVPRTADLGGFTVERVLPTQDRRMVGPFIFFDQMGPGEFLAGQGLDVRPHPHIGLATVTYLFAGEILHRDTLGSRQSIEPGDVNWMTAGSGIAHSERTDAALRAKRNHLFGIQSWVALPRSQEEAAPAFVHHPAATLPVLEDRGMRLRLIAGDGWGARSPVAVLSPLFYADATLTEGASVALPKEHEERAVYVLRGAVDVAGSRFEAGRLLIFRPGDQSALRSAEGEARLLLLGGAPMDGARHLFWNFVSSSRDRIEQAKADWKSGRFGKVPGDDQEYIPLPEPRRVPAQRSSS